MIDVNAVRDMYLSGATAHAVGAHFGITQRQVQRLARLHGFRRIDAGQRKAQVIERDNSDPLALAKAALGAAADAARRGDAKGIEAAARAAERVMKASAMMAERMPAPEEDEPQADFMRRIQTRLAELYAHQARYDSGHRDKNAVPLWQTFDRPDLRKPGELPVVHWLTGGRGPEPVSVPPVEALYDMEVDWLKRGLIKEHSKDTEEFRALMEQGLAGHDAAVREWEERRGSIVEA